MTTKTILFFLIYLQCTCTAHTQESPKAREANDLLAALITDSGVTGAAAGYAVEGKTAWKNAAGYRCAEDQLPFTDSTRTRTASIAKTMTAVAIMQLVEQGRIDLDLPVQTYLPDYPKKKAGDITVRQLLAHTSGIGQYQSEKEAENQTDFPSLEAAMAVFKDRDLLFEPGTAYYYTTYGYVVLGRIIEVVSGQSYEAYLQKNIWDVAGMTRTGVEKLPSNPANRSCLYQKHKRKTKAARANNLSNRVPGGGLFTTLDDMIRFGNAIVENRLIKAATLEQMTQSQFAQKAGNPYGLGWFLYGPPPHESVVIGHSGEQTGAATQIMLIPKSKTVVVVLANTSGTWKDVVTLASALIGISEKPGQD